MNRKITASATLTLAAAIAPFATEAATKTDKPNIVVLFADDISAREFPIYNSSVWSDTHGENTTDETLRAKTPVMDRLAKEGCWISTCWGASVSSPSRAMMMTGRFASTTKWWHNGDCGTYLNAQGKEEKWPLYESSPLQMAKLAQMGGYATYWAEKTQMPYPEKADKYGFDEGCYTPGELAFGAVNTDFTMKTVKDDQGKKLQKIEDSGRLVDTYPQISYYWMPGVALVNDPSCKEKNTMEAWPNTPESKASFGLNSYGPDIATDHIFNFIDRKNKEGKPFFIYHTTHLGHASYDFINPDVNSLWAEAPKVKWTGKKYLRTEPNITGDKGEYNLNNSLAPAGMHSQISYIDYIVWRYMEKFKKMGIDDNTVFIIAADNGSAKYGKGSVECQKGAHIPLIIYAPCLKMTKKGEQDVLANICDILPTVAEIAGVEIPDSYKINGESMLSFLTTKQAEHRDWIYTYKSSQQLIRGDKVLKDGTGVWYDVTARPADLISFPVIKDWSTVSQAHRDQKAELEKLLTKFDNYASEHDGPGGTMGPKTSSKKSKAKAAAAATKAKKKK